MESFTGQWLIHTCLLDPQVRQEQATEYGNSRNEQSDYEIVKIHIENFYPDNNCKVKSAAIVGEQGKEAEGSSQSVNDCDIHQRRDLSV